MSKRKLTLFSACALALSQVQQAQGVHATWMGPAGNWNEAANWSSSPAFPNNTPGNFYDAVVNNTSAVVNLNGGSYTVSSFALLNGTLTGAGTLSLLDTGTWSGGAIASVGTININSNFVLDAGVHFLSSVTLHNHAGATMQWADGDIAANTPQEGGRIINDGVFVDLTERPWTWSNALIPVMDNNGLYRVQSSVTAFTKAIQAQFNNSGTLSVESRDLRLEGGGTHSGTFLVSAGQLLFFSDFHEGYASAGAGTTHFTASSVIDSQGSVTFGSFFGSAQALFEGSIDTSRLQLSSGGDGSVVFAAGSRVLQNSLPDVEQVSGKTSFNSGQTGGVTLNNGTITGGTIGGSDDLYFLGDVTIDQGGILGSGGSVAVVYGALEITGIWGKSITDTAFYTGPGQTSNINGDGPVILTSADFINSAGATLSINANSSLNDGGGTFTSRFFNDGTLVQNSAGTTQFTGVEMYNGALGVINVNNGVLSLLGGGSLAGTVNIAAARVLELGGNFTISASGLINGGSLTTLRLRTGSTLSSGTILTDTLEVNGNNFTSTGATVQANYTVIAPGSFSDGSMTFSDGTFSNTSFIQVGANGSGTLILGNGANMTSVVGDLAVFSNLSYGFVRVEGAGTRWDNSDLLRLGFAGAGVMEIKGGGEVTNAVATLGETAGSSGKMTVDGAGSKWTNGGFVNVGLGGVGTVNITNGGRVINTTEATVLAILPGGQGHVVVSGAGSRWDSASQLAIGSDGYATMRILDGGVMVSRKGPSVTSSAGIIGRRGDGIGDVEVSGAGSRWENPDGHVVIGFGSLTSADSLGGKGTLTISNGGVVSAINGYLARFPGSRGSVLIDGATSQFQMSGFLVVGGDDSAGGGTAGFSQLNGKVTCPGGIRIWPHAGYRYAGGTLSTSTLQLNGGGTMSLDGGANKVLQVTALSIDPDSHLDLTDNRAIVDYTTVSPIASIRGYLRTGYANAAWNGKGIMSSTAAGTPDKRQAIAYGENSVLNRGTFGGASVDSTSILISTTYCGDANMNGTVDSTDFSTFVSGYGALANAVWTQGDFDYDGRINTLDFNHLAYNFGLTYSPAPAPSLGAVVPEPATGMVASLTMLFLARRARRFRS